VTPRAIIALLCVLTAGGARRLQTGAVEGTLHATDVRTAGAVVYLVPAGGGVPAEVADTALVDQDDLRFEPRVLAVKPGTTVEFQNSDPILHNVFSPSGRDGGFDLGTYPRGDRRSHTFTDPGAYVILCHVHPEMVAYVVVVPTSYHAVADEDGRFRLEGLPPGRYVLAVWHYRAAPFERAVEIAPGTVLHLELDLARARHAGRH
jgi:plastocyanin